jgi:hypothetical protein
MQVPVSTTIPVKLDVGVDIPLQETELAAPFNTLRTLFQPLDHLLDGLPSSNQDLYDRLSNRQNSDSKARPIGVLTP